MSHHSQKRQVSGCVRRMGFASGALCGGREIHAFPRLLSPHPGPLPRGEGDSQPVSRPIQRYEFTTTRATALPLPKGEGRGEGEVTVRLPDAPEFCNRLSVLGFRLKTLRFGLAVALTLQPHVLWACAACTGQSDSAMAKGMNLGILSLLAVIGMVLGGVVSFFVYLGKKSATMSAVSAAGRSVASAERA
jgi:hypothetical protein